MSSPMTTIGCRLQGMAVKDHPIGLGIPAPAQSILFQFQDAMFIELDLKQDQLTAKDLEKATSLKLFMKTHCHETHYMFQVKKCSDQRVIIARNILSADHL